MKPWFEKEILEGDVIKFPEPKEKVIWCYVGHLYDFLTGVKDLQNRLSDGQISQESYDKLYADLIQRFMKKESFENPWFLRELKADQLKIDVQKAIQSLNPDDPEHINLLSKLYTTLNKTDYNSRVLQVFSKDNKKIGQITSGIFSPKIKKNIGLSMILKEYWNVGESVFIQTLDGGKRNGTITSLPFAD